MKVPLDGTTSKADSIARTVLLVNGPMALGGWYLDGKLHREDGPAVEWANGNKFWYLNGRCHREDGPAIEHTNGNKFWYLNGKRHREDGPAVELTNGTKWWYLDGKELTEAEFLARTKKEPTCEGRVVTIDGKSYRLQLEP